MGKLINLSLEDEERYELLLEEEQETQEEGSLEYLFKHSNLAPSQLLFWTGIQWQKEISDAYNLKCVLSLSNSIQVDHFQKAFQALINSSDALRMVFYEKEGIPQYKIYERLSYILEFFDFSFYPNAHQKSKNCGRRSHEYRR